MTSRELWRPIPGTDGWYEVSNHGRVRSWKRGRWGRAASPRAMKPQPVGKYGHLKVTLYLNGGSQQARVHVLVLRTFRGPPAPGHEARHLNGKAGDNRLPNLAWGTRQENVDDARRHGTLARGERNGHAKLTWKKVRAIRRRALKGEESRALAHEFGVNDATMHDVVRNKAWVDPNYKPSSSKWGQHRDPAVRKRVMDLKKSGNTNAAIAREIGMSWGFVGKIVREEAVA